MSAIEPNNPIIRLLAVVTSARRSWQILLFVLVGTVLYLAVTPDPPKRADLGWDKLNHACAFAALTAAGCFAFPGSRRRVLGVMFSMLALGGLIEIVQYFVPGRSCDWRDLVADAVGMILGAAVALVVLTLARRAPSAPA